MAHHLAGRDHAAVGLHHLDGHSGPELGLEACADPLHVAGDATLGERVDQCRHRALVLPVFRPHLGGDRHVRLGMLPRENVPHALLVRRVGVAVEKADADRRDALPPAPAGHLDRRRLVELPQDLTLVAHALGNLAHPLNRHDPLRLHPEVGVPIALGHALPRDLENVPEPLGRHQPEAVEPLLEERVGGDRRPVRDRRHCSRRCAGEAEDLPDPLQHGERRVVGGGRRLGGEDLAGRLVHRDDVGERAAGVDPDPQAPSHSVTWPFESPSYGFMPAGATCSFVSPTLSRPRRTRPDALASSMNALT
jgi:hypothetical protein